MSEIGQEILAAARSHLGKPFRHHFKPFNFCEGGTFTLPGCMRRGLGPDGFDCSGLVVASTCEVLGVDVSAWPTDYRHLRQMLQLVRQGECNSGDIVCVNGYKADGQEWQHMGVAADYTKIELVHASGHEKQVVEGRVLGTTHQIISAEVIANLVTK